MASIIKYYRRTVKEKLNFDSPHLHDPCAVAFLIDPSIFEYRLMRVEVETGSHLFSGATVCDIYNFREYANRRKNVYVLLDMDVDKFWDITIDALMKANKQSPANL